MKNGYLSYFTVKCEEPSVCLMLRRNINLIVHVLTPAVYVLFVDDINPRKSLIKTLIKFTRLLARPRRQIIEIINFIQTTSC
jgi:hypothetical protein